MRCVPTGLASSSEPYSPHGLGVGAPLVVRQPALRLVFVPFLHHWNLLGIRW
jgi:hypothetical protein